MTASAAFFIAARSAGTEAHPDNPDKPEGNSDLRNPPGVITNFARFPEGHALKVRSNILSATCSICRPLRDSWIGGPETTTLPITVFTFEHR
jgi:hypothetical protein